MSILCITDHKIFILGDEFMSATVYNFKRYELKYMISRTQYEELLYQLRNHIVEDKFFKSSISNIYYDTPSYKLIRQSLEKPIYKEQSIRI